jgi:hypothetical protein
MTSIADIGQQDGSRHRGRSMSEWEFYIFDVTSDAEIRPLVTAYRKSKSESSTVIEFSLASYWGGDAPDRCTQEAVSEHRRNWTRSTAPAFRLGPRRYSRFRAYDTCQLSNSSKSRSTKVHMLLGFQASNETLRCVKLDTAG